MKDTITTLPQGMQKAAENFPDAVAFRFGKDALTYTQLDQKTNQLATYLISMGLKKGDRVGVYMNRSIETAIAIYGIMKAGGAYVPLDAALPVKRIGFLLNDCGIEHLVSIPKLAKKHQKLMAIDTPLKSIVGNSEELSITTISWDALFNNFSKKPQAIELFGHDLAYIMYTSGSTGNPKGIMHTHSSGLAYAELSIKEFNIDETDVLANHSPLHFDISTLGYFSGPLAGATTVIIPEAHTKMPLSLVKLTEDEKITIWYSVPLALVQMYCTGELHKKNFGALRLVLFGGETFPNKYLAELMRLWPNTHFYNIYGPAEVNQCTCHRVEHPPKDDEQLSIGKVWERTQYKILNANAEVPFGEVGELAIASATMMKGYWKNTALTEKSVYEDDGLRYFRTGDMVKENEKGLLFFLGRNDRQVKIRGYRIELEGVEARIMAHGDVAETSVFVTHLEKGNKEIIAAVRLHDDTANILSEKDLLHFCAERLPIYALPKTIVFVDSIPRMPSGKIDRKKIQRYFEKHEA